MKLENQRIVIKILNSTMHHIVDAENGVIYCYRKGEYVPAKGEEKNGKIRIKIHNGRRQSRKTKNYHNVHIRAYAHIVVWISKKGEYDPDKYTVIAKDGNYKNYQLKNLELIDKPDVQIRRKRNADITDFEIRKIRSLMTRGMATKDIATAVGKKEDAVRRIISKISGRKKLILKESRFFC